MKKLLIVNNNLQIGGIQKSLVNLLKGISKDYDVTLLLYANYGRLAEQIPKDVKIVYSSCAFRTLGIPWNSIKKKPLLVIHKLFITALTVLVGKGAVMKYLSLYQKRIGGYDAVISYSHCTNARKLSICCPEFVLNCTDSTNKICFIHCDYPNSGTISEYNNNIYRAFDKIACCSNSVKDKFLSVIPELANKTVTVRNFYDTSIMELAKQSPYLYDPAYINLITVCRLSEEKGVLEAIEELYKSGRQDIRYYIVGSGALESKIKYYIVEKKMEDRVYMLGEQDNPYRFMYKADYLVVPSLHEAAPMVFDEAKILNLPVISTNTTSAKEMLSEGDFIVDSIDKIFTLSLSKTIKQREFQINNEYNKVLFDDLIVGNHYE